VQPDCRRGIPLARPIHAQAANLRRHHLQADEIAALAVETGVWPLKEAVDGQVRHTYVLNRLKPVEEYLRPQRRFRHLFQPTRQDQILKQIQDNVNAYWQLLPERERPQLPT
jgi:pyruvate/2-oxoacid:ferredoxin oxidoreductase beta subunit